jgi:hypothetical protein
LPELLIPLYFPNPQAALVQAIPTSEQLDKEIFRIPEPFFRLTYIESVTTARY